MTSFNWAEARSRENEWALCSFQLAATLRHENLLSRGGDSVNTGSDLGGPACVLKLEKLEPFHHMQDLSGVRNAEHDTISATALGTTTILRILICVIECWDLKGTLQKILFSSCVLFFLCFGQGCCSVSVELATLQLMVSILTPQPPFQVILRASGSCCCCTRHWNIQNMFSMNCSIHIFFS